MTTTDDRTHGGVFPDVDRVDQVIRQMPEVGFGAHYVDAVRAARDALAALSSPPADDVREVLAAAIFRTDLGPDGLGGDLTRAEILSITDRILSDPRFEVRPRGTVTDAERAAINGALIEVLPIWTSEIETEYARSALLRAIVPALEAARGVRVSAENADATQGSPT